MHGIDDLRPISILPTLSKVVENIMKDQMLDMVSFSIYAFRKGYNTTGLLLTLTENIRQSVNDGYMSVLISLDLSKAFNCIDHVKLVNTLRDEFKFSNSACMLIFSYLVERRQFMELNGIRSVLLSLSTGVPHGSILGPLLFML